MAGGVAGAARTRGGGSNCAARPPRWLGQPGDPAQSDAEPGQQQTGHLADQRAADDHHRPDDQRAADDGTDDHRTDHDSTDDHRSDDDGTDDDGTDDESTDHHSTHYHRADLTGQHRREWGTCQWSVRYR